MYKKIFSKKKNNYQPLDEQENRGSNTKVANSTELKKYEAYLKSLQSQDKSTTISRTPKKDLLASVEKRLSTNEKTLELLKEIQNDLTKIQPDLEKFSYNSQSNSR